MERKEEVRLVWAGVEFQPMNAALARALDGESATRGGARGLLVTGVYDRSPAARSGIRVRDVLLSLGLPDTAGEIDLNARPREGDAGKSEERPRPWRGAYNYLTDILTRIGPGREVQLKVLRDRKEIVVPLALENAPDDFDNADQFNDDLLGLTVRALTYEVRYLLRLPADAPGVVVSEVQPGSKAAVGQIQMYEIISHVNNEPVRTLKDFERLVQAAAATGKVEFLVSNLGVQSIVELNLGGTP
jgi:serine protease Do